MTVSSWRDALKDFARAVGDEHVSDDAAQRKAASTATFATTATARAIVRPDGVEQVRECVRVARAHRVPLYPVSRATNWGYGSRVAIVDGSVLLDLSRMNRIVEFDEELAYFTIEPGVTFRQAHEFLRRNRSRLLLSAIGGSPDSSLIGNFVERGIAKGPYGDRPAHGCALEVVTGSGELVRTGLSRFDNARAAPLHRWGSGPALDGLFSQSSFGVVTKMTQWLVARPGHFVAMFYQLSDESALPAVIDALRSLLLRGVLRPTLTLYNDVRVCSSVRSFPFDREDGARAMSDRLRRELRDELNIGPWGGDVCIYAPDAAHAELSRSVVERALRPLVDRIELVEANESEIDLWFSDDAPTLSDGSSESLRRGLVRNYLGIPDDEAIRGCYWRKPREQQPPRGAELSPDRDGCGLLWCTPVVPFRGSDVRRAASLASDVMIEHDFDPALTVQCITERAVYLVASIAYDRAIAGNDARALECYRALCERLTLEGYPPYRRTIASMSADASMGPVLDEIAKVLDPDRIMAPGRYRLR